MKILMMTAAAAALALPLSAQAGDQAKKNHTMKADVHTETQISVEKQVMKFETPKISARELLGEGVIGVNGERIARIDDIVIGADGRADDVVFLSGGVFGLGGKRGALDFDRVSLTLDHGYDPVVRASLTEDSIKTARAFETKENNDYSLVSEIIGSKITVEGAGPEEEGVVVNDILMSRDGVATHVIVQETAIANIGAGLKYALDFNLLAEAQGDGGLVLNLSERALKASPIYTSWEATAIEGWGTIERETPKGVDIEEAADKASDAMLDAADAASDAAKDAADAAEDAAEAAADEMEDAADKLD